MSKLAIDDTEISMADQLPQFENYDAVVAVRKEKESVVNKAKRVMNSGSGDIFVRLAGVMGALAVALAAYGAHVFVPGHPAPELVQVFDTGSRFHLLHSIALLCVPLTKRPLLVGTLMLTGMIIFSGTCYVHALTGRTEIVKYTPYGGTLLIIAWLSMII